VEIILGTVGKGRVKQKFEKGRKKKERGEKNNVTNRRKREKQYKNLL